MSIETLVEHLTNKNLSESQETFDTLMADRILEAIKNVVEEDDEDEEETDEIEDDEEEVKDDEE